MTIIAKIRPPAKQFTTVAMEIAFTREQDERDAKDIFSKEKWKRKRKDEMELLRCNEVEFWQQDICK